MTLPLPPPLSLLLPPPQLLVKLRCPDHPPLSFCGSSPGLGASDRVAAGGDDSNSVDDDHDNSGPDSEAWGKALSREIAKLKREAGEGSQQLQQAGPTTAGARGIGSWRLWNVVSGVVGGGAAAAGAATAAETGLNGVSDGGVSSHLLVLFGGGF